MCVVFVPILLGYEVSLGVALVIVRLSWLLLLSEFLVCVTAVMTLLVECRRATLMIDV